MPGDADPLDHPAALISYFEKVTDMTISISRSARLRQVHAAAIVASLAFLSLSTLSAVAAEFAQPRAVVAASPWTGFYIGVHGGGGWGSSRLQDPDFELAFDPVNIRSQGALAGAQVGANWQFGNVVIGGELDASWSSIKGNRPADPAFFMSGLTVDYRALATGTGRVGYATGNLLGYAKAGLAWANIDITRVYDSIAPLDVNHQRAGLTAGAGVEWALLSNLSARLEYDYIYFGANSISLGTRRNPSNLDHDLHLLKLGLNWRVGGDNLAARY